MLSTLCIMGKLEYVILEIAVPRIAVVFVNRSGTLRLGDWPAEFPTNSSNDIYAILFCGCFMFSLMAYLYCRIPYPGDIRILSLP